MTTTMSDEDVMRGRIYLERTSVVITDDEKARACITLASSSQDATDFRGISAKLGFNADNHEEALALLFIRRSPESYPHDSMMP